MTENELIDRLNAAQSLSGLDGELVLYIRAKVADGTAKPETQQQVAYHLAGLLSTRAVAATPDESPVKRVLLLAGQLELPVEHRAVGASWQQLEQDVRSL